MKEYFCGMASGDKEHVNRFIKTLFYEDMHAAVLEMRKGNPLQNLMLGVSCENQEMADKRIPLLLEIPAWKRVVSLEPLIGAVDLREIELPIDGRYKSVNHIMGYHINALTTHDDDHYYNRHQALDWVILGAETGPGARPMNLDWARSVRDECSAAGVPFFFKKDSDGNTTLDGAEERAWPA